MTLVLYILLSLGFSSYLPLKFCHLFDGLLGSTRTNDDEIQTCRWQIFGFRIVFMVLYFPVELITMAVVYRHSNDLSFQLDLKRHVKPGQESEFIKLQMTSTAFRMNNADEVDLLLNLRNPEEVRSAILINRYYQSKKLDESEMTELRRA